VDCPLDDWSLGGGLVFDNFNPNYVWYIGGVLCIVAVFAFYLLHIRLGAKEQFQRVETKQDAVPS